MSQHPPHKRSWMKRILLIWLPTGVLLAVFLILGLWVIPRRSVQIVSADGQWQWPTTGGEHRQIRWAPPQPLKGLVKDKTLTSVLTPCLAEGGTVLYFASRRANGRVDLYRARRARNPESGSFASHGTHWQSAEPIKELNSPADDLRPVLSADGRTLYFASNRRGGKGGYDLYVSRRDGKKWGTPRNLGSRVNSPADEHSPALAPDGLALYFASDRDKRGSLDLFVTRRENPKGNWQQPSARTALNQADSNETTPFVSATGTFLYFASDRPNPSGQLPNFDLYRARLREGTFIDPEHLGADLNTADNENAPALSIEGFSVVFARRDQETTRLYRSTAHEVYRRVQWDTSNWQALMAYRWHMLIIAALFLGTALALRFGGDRVLEAAIAVRFGAASLGVHLLLLLALWVVPVARAVLQRAEEIRVEQNAVQLFDDNQHQSHEDGRQAYEKVADLKSVKPVPLPDLTRRTPTPPGMPQRNEGLTPTLPVNQARHLPPERLLYVPPKEQVTLQSPRPLRRRSRADPAAPVALREVLPELPPPEGASTLKPPQPTEIEQVRKETPLPSLPPKHPTKGAASQPTPAEVQPAPMQPPRLAARQRPNRLLRRGRAVPSEAATRTEPIVLPPPLPPRKTLEPKKVPVAIVRRQPDEPEPILPTPRTTRPPSLPDKAVVLPMGEKPQLRRRTSPFSRRRTRPREPKPGLLPRSDQGVALAPSTPEPAEKPLTGVKLDLKRSDLIPTELPVLTPRRLAGPTYQRQPAVGTVNPNPVEAPPAFGPLVSRLPRKPARATRVAIAVDNIGSRAMFQLRQGDIRKRYIDLFGGTEESEKAVERGLAWLAAHQNTNGSWSMHNHHAVCRHKKHKPCPGAGNVRSNSASTGLALLPFLAAGHTHKAKSQYQDVVRRALDWIIKQQKKDGNLLAAGDSQHIYSHAIAAIALCEAYGMTRDPALKQPAQLSLEYLTKAQHTSSGGWRYNPRQLGDTSVLGWVVMALKSGELAGLKVPRNTLAGAQRWLKRVEGKKWMRSKRWRGTRLIRGFGYQRPSLTPSMTAEGLLCVQFLTDQPASSRVKAGIDFLMMNLPKKGQESSYYWYYATQVLYHSGGKEWKEWNPIMRKLLEKTQRKDGTLAGSWDPEDGYERSAGRIYTTALRLLILEVYYRHLPLSLLAKKNK